MGQDTHAERVEEFTFHIRQLSVKDARRLMLRVAPLVGAIAGGVDLDAAKDGKLDGATMIGAVVGALGHVKIEDYEWICEVLGKISEVEYDDGRRQFLSAQVQERLFSGRRKLELSWLGHALQVQFADFFGESTSG